MRNGDSGYKKLSARIAFFRFFYLCIKVFRIEGIIKYRNYEKNPVLVYRDVRCFFACTSGQHTGTAPALVQVSAFDTVLDGSDVSLYTLRNDSGMVVQVTNYGARVVSLWVPDAKGDFQDVVWGYESIHDYLDSPDRFCGPVVGRYGNRIGKGRFTLDGKSYRLTLNDGENHLHGGADGFWNKGMDRAAVRERTGEQAVEMSYRSPDGEEGYPGNLSIAVTYTLQKNNALKIEYQAMTDAPTILNPTSHNYFNLHGNTASVPIRMC